MNKIVLNKKRLPSISAMTAFEAAAKYESFTIAASELNLTQGAVSRQVKSLEDYLQVELFRRSPQKIELTDIGRKVAYQINNVLEQFSISLEGIDTKERSRLVIGVLPAFANRWLIPKLGNFIDICPDIDIELIFSSNKNTLVNKSCDVVIGLNPISAPNIINYEIGGEDFIVVATGEWLKKNNVSTVRDLIGKHLLVELRRPDIWDKWFLINGISLSNTYRKIYFDYFDMVVTAVNHSLGAALVPKILVQSEIDSGKLVILEGEELFMGASYVLSHEDTRQSYEPLLRFKKWLKNIIRDS